MQMNVSSSYTENSYKQTQKCDVIIDRNAPPLGEAPPHRISPKSRFFQIFSSGTAPLKKSDINLEFWISEFKKEQKSGVKVNARRVVKFFSSESS